MAPANPCQDNKLLAVEAYTEDANWYDGTASGGLVVRNDPVNATDPTGMERRLPTVTVPGFKPKRPPPDLGLESFLRGLRRQVADDAGKVAGDVARAIIQGLKEEAKEAACDAAKPVGVSRGVDAFHGAGATTESGISFDPRNGKISAFQKTGVGAGKSVGPYGQPIAPFVAVTYNAPSGISSDVTGNASVSTPVGGASVSRSFIGMSGGQYSAAAIKGSAGLQGNVNGAAQVSLPLTPDLYSTGCD